MRAITITLLICMFIALSLGIFCSCYTHHVSQEYQLQIEDTAFAIQENQWKDALEKILFLEKHWEKHAHILSLFTDHGEVDAVSLALTQLRVSIEEQERYHALLYAAEICETLVLIHSRAAFVLKNIL